MAITAPVPTKQYRIDILPYAEAPWAPSAPGTALRWAWRIVDAAGNARMCGCSNLPEADLRRLAEAAVSRLGKAETGKPPKTNPLLKRKTTRNARPEVAAARRRP